MFPSIFDRLKTIAETTITQFQEKNPTTEDGDFYRQGDLDPENVGVDVPYSSDETESEPFGTEYLDLFDRHINDYVIRSKSFHEVEDSLNKEFEQLKTAMFDQIWEYDIPLAFDAESDSFVATKEFPFESAPFAVHLLDWGIEVVEHFDSISLQVTCDTRNVKNIFLNRISHEEFPYFIMESYPTIPSTLTVMLKYAIKEFKQGDLDSTEIESRVIWNRDFRTMSLIFDFMRETRKHMRELAFIITNHHHAFYLIPKAIADELVEYLDFSIRPYRRPDFKITLEAFSKKKIPTASGSLRTYYFK